MRVEDPLLVKFLEDCTSQNVRGNISDCPNALEALMTLASILGMNVAVMKLQGETAATRLIEEDVRRWAQYLARLLASERIVAASDRFELEKLRAIWRASD